MATYRAFACCDLLELGDEFQVSHRFGGVDLGPRHASHKAADGDIRGAWGPACMGVAKRLPNGNGYRVVAVEEIPV